MYLIRSGGTGAGVCGKTVLGCRGFRGFQGLSVFRGCLFYRSGLMDLLKGFEERGDVGFIGIIRYSDGFGFQITLQVFHSFFKSDILHDLVAASLTMNVTRENHGLAVIRPLGAPFPAFPLKGEGE